MAEELVTRDLSGRGGGSAGARQARRAPVVAFTTEQQWWLDKEVRPMVEQVAAELAGVGAGGPARRRHQRWAWRLMFGLVVFVTLVGLGVLVGAVVAHGVRIVP
jgi:hypothetical protein